MKDIKMLRMLLADVDGAVWGDDELETCLSQARRRFSDDSGFYTETFSPHVDEQGTFSLPSGYSRMVVAWANDGTVMERGSEQLAEDMYGPLWRKEKGHPIMTMDNGSGQGRMVPNPYELQNSVELVVEIDSFYDYGTLIADGSLGVTVDGGIGVADASTGSCGVEYEPVADIHYTRQYQDGDPIPDQMSIVRLAAHYAHLADNDLASVSAAEYHLAQYRYRLGVLKNVRKTHSTMGRFF